MAIVKMKHLRLAAMQSDREALLRLLQGMGCLEIEEPSVDWSDPEWAGLKSPDSGALSAAREEKNAAQHALEVLKRYAKVKGGLLSPRPVVSPQQFFEEQAYRSALETARAINDGERELAALKAERDKRAAQRASLAPWIPLELPLDTASTREVEVQFGTVSAETPFAQLAGEVQAVSELAQLTLALLACFRDIRRSEPASGAKAGSLRYMTLYVAFFGAALFLMLWEARGRYLFGFVAVLLLLAAHGALQTEEGM